MKDFKDKVGESYNRYERIKLYKTYKDLNNLLNFTITDAEEACTAQIKEEPNIGCLTAENWNDDFNQDNLSAYDTTIDVGGNTAYCANLFDLSSNYTDTFSSGLSAIAGNPSSDATSAKSL